MKICPACQNSYPNSYAVCPQDGTPLMEQGAWVNGAVIRGKYRILEKVGQGGMGAVYKASHLAFDELRALKVISMELMSDELFVKRFKHEAVISRKLQHPNAVRIDDIDEAEDGRPFIVMEFIEGRSLKKLIKDEGPLAVPRVGSIIKQVCLGLDAAHRLGMIHRDIKPENIEMINAPNGEVAKVLDFGIAKMKEARMGAESAGLTMTGTGVVIGTPQYMSPEQAMGKRGDQLDGRSDLYSLGVVMYQMLTGDLPFKADTTMEMLLAHVQKTPPPMRLLHPELQIPTAISNVVMRLLEKDREKRPASAAALISELDAALAEPGAPIPGLRQTVVVNSQQIEQDLEEMRKRRQPAQPPPPPPPVQPRQVRPPAPPPPQPAPPVQPPVQLPVQPPIQRYGPPAVVVPPPRPAGTNWGLIALVVVIFMILGAGGFYFLNGPSGQKTTPTENVTPQNPPPGGKTDPGTSNSQTGQSQSNPNTNAGNEETKPAAQDTQQPADHNPPPFVKIPSRPRAAVAERVRQAISLGNVLRTRGDYDAAIAEYRRGLEADPGNSVLIELINKARSAKRAEESLPR